ncbi:Slu7p [Malassezia vespertilionis]|uniref:Pre-mRNA-splicing factor SLU7 n=1 Tax=Malassezia vespertilionis TaxID=2020962 RepID=A0A2N1J946_9BASI|nr:Slu7p [Malassezia vespertilionis]
MSSAGKLSREEYRQQKELEAARKAGTAPPARDDDGREINPHIPHFMLKAPWYMDAGKPSLKHQRKQEACKEEAGLDDWYVRGAVAGPSAGKYRKGACENCGSMSHKTKDCLERPRKRGAKWTGKDIRPDEVVQSLDKDFGYDAKRDRWNGYDPSMYKDVVHKYEAIEEERRRLREEEIDHQGDAEPAKKKEKKRSTDDAFDSSSSESEDDEKYAEKADMVGQGINTDTRVTVRNLRIREDRAKYLNDLNSDSAHYDPKTRSMRDAPYQGAAVGDFPFAGDGFQRAQSGTADMQKMQLFAWQAESRGNAAMHMQANPTVNEIQFKEFQQKNEQHLAESKSSILERYGGEEHLNMLPKELLGGQTEEYVEYSPAGHVIRGQERAKAKSRYEEDVYENNHTTYRIPFLLHG